MNILIESTYAGPIAWYQLLFKAEAVTFDQHEHFVKASYRNRCRIASPNGVLTLSVPIENGRNKQQVINDVRIHNTQSWQSLHWQSICTAYRRSPFFEYYEDDLHAFYHTTYDSLWSFNTDLFVWIAAKLGKELNYDFSKKYESESETDKKDFRSAVHTNPKKDQSAVLVSPIVYRQVFEEKTGFLPNLSIFDLLFAEGPNAGALLQGSM